MTIKLYNTLTNKMEQFTPIEKQKIGIYACGVTVYDEPHIGHARQAIVFDVLRNYFELLGYDVTYVRNYTDVDDKIINKANECNKKFNEISEYYIEKTKKDLKALKVFPATYEPKATEFIDHMIQFILSLVSTGMAYESKGNVFFRVNKFKDYGKLSNISLSTLRENDGYSEEKENLHDFTLWKRAKEGEPFWDSPWGKGRPGWHIECSVMAEEYLGQSFDIHGGGIDLIFPHHENEIAQSEAKNGKRYVNYWLHNGLVMVDGKKMSKSLGNFFTIEEILDIYQPDVVRLMVLSHHFSSQIDFTKELFELAEKKCYYFYKTLNKIDEFIENEKYEESELDESLINNFKNSMNDNFNTAKFIGFLHEQFGIANTCLTDKKIEHNSKVKKLSMFRNAIIFISKVLRILDDDPLDYINKVKLKILKDNEVSQEYIEENIKLRNEAKKNKDYQLADKIRDDLNKRKISLMDIASETVWDIII